MSQDHLVSVNVHDGFLPIFAPIFMEHYGSSSIFVRTLADCFTLRLARVLEKQGKLESPELVARHSTNQAVERLEQWLSTVDGANRTAMQEALGLLPLGSMALLVEKEFGVSASSNGWSGSTSRIDESEQESLVTLDPRNRE